MPPSEALLPEFDQEGFQVFDAGATGWMITNAGHGIELYGDC